MSLLKKTSWSVFATISQSITGLISLIIITRFLESADAGFILYVIWLVDISAVIFGLGFQSSIIKFTADIRAKFSEKLNIIQNWIFNKYLAGIIFGSLILLFLLNNEIILGENYKLSIILIFIIRSLYFYYLSYLSGFQNFKLLSFVVFLSNTLQLFFLIVLINKFGINGAIYSYVFGAIVPAFLILKINKKYLVQTSNIDYLIKKRIWKYSREIWFTLLVSALIWSKFEIYFIEKYAGLEAVAFYSVALTFSIIISQIPNLISAPLLPYFSEQHALEKLDGIDRIYKILTIFLSFVIFPLSFFLAAILPTLIPLIYGSEYISSIVPAQILVIFAALGFATVGAAAVMAMEKTKFMAFSGVFGGALLIILCIFLVPLYAGVGAAIARSITQSIMIILGLYYVGMSLKLSVPYRGILKIFLSAAIGALASYFIIFIIGGLWMVPIALLLGVTIYLFLIKFTKPFNLIGFEYIHLIVEKYPNFLRTPILFFIKI